MAENQGFSANDPPAANAEDLASTDMDQQAVTRADDVAAIFGEGRDADREREIASLKDQHLRLAAEFDNYRKRIAKERVELTDRAQASFVAKILDVLDDLDRIVASDPASTPLATLREGLTAVDKKLWKELQAAGVERIDPIGAPFNPAEHEAVAMVPTADPAQDHTVALTYQPGYKVKGQLVRPARVQVYAQHGSV